MPVLARVRSGVLVGLRGMVVDVEVAVTNGLPSFDIVGLPDAAVRESRERVRAAIRHSGLEFPVRRITVNLTPTDLRKEGPHLDLPIAVAVLAASGQAGLARAEGFALFGTLSLDGTVRPVTGALPLALTAREAGLAGVCVPAGNAPEAALVTGLQVLPAKSLREVIDWLSGRGPVRPGGQGGTPAPGRLASAVPPGKVGAGRLADLADVRGQAYARTALEVAAAVGHNLLMVGPPGSGKTMLARTLLGILPPLSPDEALEVTAIYSAAGHLPVGAGLAEERPFRAPHHSASVAALVGGGPGLRPGEVTLAHRGVLFLDELTEFARDALESLRQPLEEGTVSVARARGSAVYPARFTLVAAANPCACGYWGDRRVGCTCAPHQLRRYQSRLSGPFFDRIDMHIWVERLSPAQLLAASPGEPSARVRERVVEARLRQIRRLGGLGLTCNAQMGRAEITRFCRLDAETERRLHGIYGRLGLSLRGLDRVMKVARTLADLDGCGEIASDHVTRAVGLRQLDRAPASPAAAARCARGSRK